MDLTLSPTWVIELSSDDRTARLAASELSTHLQALGSPALATVGVASGPRIALHHGPAGEGFVRSSDADGLVLRGEGPRGLLYAVYELLEALGCRWPAPGAALTPRRELLVLPADAIADRPALPRRGLIIGHDHFLDEAEGWIVWGARNRLNTLFIHTTISEPALGACRLAGWRKRRRALLPLIRERAMALELGGHHLRDLLPRRLFSIDRDMFRHDGKRRVADHNFCVSSQQALARVRQNAAAFYRAYPEAEVYHLWPDDLRAGGWCHCEACAALSPADQALTAANALAEALPALRGARVAYLAYHDTEEPPTHTRPHHAVMPLFAPRLRSYAAGIGVAPNIAVFERLKRCAATFDGAPALFEYYLDGILFKSSPPPLAATIGADMAAYSDAGVGAVHALLTGDRPFLQAPINAYLFARLAWAPSTDPGSLRADYVAARAPSVAAPLAQAYAELENAWRPMLARDPSAESAEDWPRGRDPVAHPPADVLDTIAEPTRTAELRLEDLAGASAALAAGRAAWVDLAAADPSAAVTLAAELAEWERAAALLGFLRLRQQLYVLVGRDAPRERIAEVVAEAQAALNLLAAWDERHVPPVARGAHDLLRAPFQLQIDHIADRYVLSPLARLGLRLRRAGDLAKILPRLVRLR